MDGRMDGNRKKKGRKKECFSEISCWELIARGSCIGMEMDG